MESGRSMTDAQCRFDDCDKRGFMIVNIGDEMLCIDHFNESFDISYLNEPDKKDN